MLDMVRWVRGEGKYNVQRGVYEWHDMLGKVALIKEEGSIGH